MAGGHYPSRHWDLGGGVSLMANLDVRGDVRWSLAIAVPHIGGTCYATTEIEGAVSYNRDAVRALIARAAQFQSKGE